MVEQNERGREASPDFLEHFHYFRGFAILCIVACHCWHLEMASGKPFANWLITFRELLFHDATIYFLFISGFLFFHLSPRFRLRLWAKRKLRRLVVPYVLMSLLLGGAVTSWVSGQYGLATTIRHVVEMLRRGSAQVAYWYIPFVLPIVATSPLLLRLENRTYRWVALGSALLPLLGTRTGIRVSMLQYLYFVPVYLFGGLAARQRGDFERLVHRWWKALGVVALLSSLVLVLRMKGPGSPGIHHVEEGLFYVQKLALTGVVLHFLQKESGRFHWLGSFATYSFPIYFVHEVIGQQGFANRVVGWLHASDGWVLLPVSVLFVAFSAVASLGVCSLLKRVSPTTARLLVGA